MASEFLALKTIQLMTEDHLKFLPYQRGPVSLPNEGTSFGLVFLW